MSWEEKEELSKVLHCSNVVKGLEDLKNNVLFCDFLVKVGNESIPVHQAVLAACSGYFRAMLSCDMREVQHGYVEMKDVHPEAVKQCINFIYTGQVDISQSTVEHLLHVSTLIELNALTKHILAWLMYHLSAENSVFFHRLTTLYDFHSEEVDTDLLKIYVAQFIKENMSEVIKGELFLNLEIDGVLHYIPDPMVTLDVQWQAVVNWVRHSESRDFEDVIYNLTLSKWPLLFILKSVWKDYHKEMSVSCKEFVTSCIFSKWKELNNFIDFDSCWDVMRLIKSNINHPAVPKVENAITQFLATNLSKAVGMKYFKKLTYDKVCEVFTLTSASEDLKWNAVKTWVKGNGKDGETLFEFIKRLDLSKLSVEFIEEQIISQPLVKLSLKCMDLLLSFMCSKLKQNIATQPMQSYCSVAGSDVNKSGLEFAIISKKSDIMCFNLSTHNWDTIVRPSYTGTIRIAGGSGDLYLLCDKRFYQWSEGLWKAMPPLKSVYTEAKMIGNRERIYLVGSKNLCYFNKVMKVWSYDMTSYKYGSSYTLAASKDHCSICVVGGNVLKKKVMEYSPTAQVGSRWESLPAMLYPRLDSAAAIYNGCIYVVGGLSSSAVTNNGERYDPTTKVWSEIPLMNMPRRRFMLCVADGNLYSVGGAFKENGKTRNKEDSIEVFIRGIDRWRHFSAMKYLDLPIQAVVINRGIINN